MYTVSETKRKSKNTTPTARPLQYVFIEFMFSMIYEKATSYFHDYPSQRMCYILKPFFPNRVPGFLRCLIIVAYSRASQISEKFRKYLFCQTLFVIRPVILSVLLFGPWGLPINVPSDTGRPFLVRFSRRHFCARSTSHPVAIDLDFSASTHHIESGNQREILCVRILMRVFIAAKRSWNDGQVDNLSLKRAGPRRKRDQLIENDNSPKPGDLHNAGGKTRETEIV